MAKHPVAQSADVRQPKPTSKLKNAIVLGSGDPRVDLRALLFKKDPRFRERVDQSYRRWNTTVREILKDEIGINVTVGDARSKIQVSIIDGLPSSIERLTRNQPIPILWLLMLHRNELEGAVTAVQVVEDNLTSVEEWVGYDPDPKRPQNLTAVGRLLQEVSLRLQKNPVAVEIYALDEDVLGAYHVRRAAVTIHWMVVALVASHLGVPIEALTLVVLVHELAHAYTHVGLDKDGESWESAGFAKTDRAVVEGLAQYYTEATLRRLGARYPQGHQAFEALLNKQPDVYRNFRTWYQRNEKHGELFYATLIDCRKARSVSYEHFRQCFDAHKMRLGLPSFVFAAHRGTTDVGVW